MAMKRSLTGKGGTGGAERIVLGIDPGLAALGWGVLRTDGIRHTYLASGTIKTTADQPGSERLAVLYDGLGEILEAYKPVEAGVETLYFAKNVSSALPVAEARGVILLGLYRKGLAVGEYTPLQIKQALVGNGKAEKGQVQEMVRLFLSLEKVPRPDHAADALAAGITHIHTSGGAHGLQSDR